MKRRATITIKKNEAGLPVLDFLSQRFNYHSRQSWLANLSEGRILINKARGIKNSVLSVGDLIEYLPVDEAEPNVSKNYSILYEDDYLLAINKPANLPCHPSRRYFNHTLWAFLKKDHGLLIPAFVNRLDRETSGVILLAKSSDTAKFCQKELQSKATQKKYIVFTEGIFPEKLKCKGWILPDTKSLIRKKQLFVPLAEDQQTPSDGKWASSTFYNIESYQGISKVEAILHTGRYHQIRATLQSIGYPIVGDKIYGVDENLFLKFINGTLNVEDRKVLRMDRQALHAAELELLHPHTGKKLKLTAPLPQDMQELFHE